MVEISPLQPSDYDAVIVLWRGAEGLTLRAADSLDGFTRYLERNPGLSFVARDLNTVVGAVLGGHDGRRGYLHHLAVAPDHRAQGLGRALVERALAALAGQGIRKCHVMVRAENSKALQFWAHTGWTLREDLVLMSHVDPSEAEA